MPLSVEEVKALVATGVADGLAADVSRSEGGYQQAKDEMKIFIKEKFDEMLKESLESGGCLRVACDAGGLSEDAVKQIVAVDLDARRQHACFV